MLSSGRLLPPGDPPKADSVNSVPQAKRVVNILNTYDHKFHLCLIKYELINIKKLMAYLVAALPRCELCGEL